MYKRQDELFQQSLQRLNTVAAMGTGAVEIKSGYGLTLAAELKMLRVIKKLQQHSDVIIKSSLLAAHTYPPEFKNNHEGYLSLIIDQLLPRVADEQLADFIDVFCEEGFFSVADMERLCEAAARYGLRPKLHVNQLNSIGAVSYTHLDVYKRQAQYLAGTGKTVAGSDRYFLPDQENETRTKLEAEGIKCFLQDGSGLEANVDLVVVSTAIEDTVPEVRQAKALQIPILKRSEVCLLYTST